MGSNPPPLETVNSARDDSQLHPTGNYGYEMPSGASYLEQRAVRQNRREARELTELSQTPKYQGQYVNGYYQTTNPAGPDYIYPHLARYVPTRWVNDRPSYQDALVNKFRDWDNRRYQATDPTRSDYLSLHEFTLGAELSRDVTWQTVDPARPLYMPLETLQYYNKLRSEAHQAYRVQDHNARQAMLAREQMKLPWWRRIAWGPQMVVAALVLLVIVIIVVVVLVTRKDSDGRQKFSPQPAQGLWGYNWTAPARCPR